VFVEMRAVHTSPRRSSRSHALLVADPLRARSPAARRAQPRPCECLGGSRKVRCAQGGRSRTRSTTAAMNTTAESSAADAEQATTAASAAPAARRGQVRSRPGASRHTQNARAISQMTKSPFEISICGQLASGVGSRASRAREILGSSKRETGPSTDSPNRISSQASCTPCDRPVRSRRGSPVEIGQHRRADVSRACANSSWPGARPF